jgi:PAS domain S-box-containing protein
MENELRVLILEDVANDAIVIHHELRKAGIPFHFKRVESKADFLYELEHHLPDIILSDHGLPEFDGLSALALAHARCPDVPFIFVTGTLGEEMAGETIKSGATDCVLKHRLSGNLVPAIQRALREAEERKLRKRAEAALRESEARKAAILETALDAIITMDHQGLVQEWNPAAEKLFGYTRQQVLGQHLDGLIISPPFLALYRDSLAEDLMTGAGNLLGRAIDITLRRADRSEFQAELGITRSPTEVPPVYTSVIRDITERKRAVEELRKSEERYRMLVENVEDYAIYLLDPEGRVATWNAGAERIEGYTMEEIIGAHFSRFYPAEDIAAGKPAEVLRIAAAEGRFKEEGWRVRKDGSRYLTSVLVTALRNEAGELYGFSKFHRDVTQRKEAEDEIRRLNNDLENRVVERTAQLEAANKELEAFSYSVSHDLRAPLRHISGFVDMLLVQGTGLTADDRGLVNTIADSASQMGKLIDDLLSFSQMGRMDMRKTPIQLNELVQSARSDLRHDIKGRDIEWRIGALPEVQGDPNMLRQVLVNLISNALKYSRTRPQSVIEISGTETAQEFELCIRDNGVGFDMKYVDRLFGVFQRLHRAKDFEGSGIGLANVRRVIARHGGRTWAEGKVNGGAAIFFSLPKQNGE